MKQGKALAFFIAKKYGGFAMTNEQRREIFELRSEGLGYTEIGKRVGLSGNAVRCYCRRNGINAPGTVAKLNTSVMQEKNEVCLNCKRRITQPTKGAPRKFCSDACRRAWWKQHPEQHQKRDSAFYELVCAGCGRPFKSYGNKRRKYCSHSCYIQTRFGGTKDD